MFYMNIMKINKINNMNFDGYKNLMAYDRHYGNKSISLLSMQLTNIGDNSLDKWLEIQKGLWKKKNNLKDTITIMNINNNGNFFVVDDKAFVVADERMKFKKEDEPYIFKLFTVMANITKDIQRGHCAPLDTGVVDIVMRDLMTMLSKMKMSAEQKTDLVLDCIVRTQKDAKQSAVTINGRIDEIMRAELD